MDIKELEKMLDEKIPRDVVSERDGGGGRKLSYLEGWYVIDRLNKIFGPLGWSKEIIDIRQVVNTTSRGEFPAYLAKVRLTVHCGVHAFKEGYGYGADKSSQNAHELAIKEAVTDALKVAAKDLGMSLGLALYDKTQEFVDDGEEKPSVTQKNETVLKGKYHEVRASRASPGVGEEQPKAPAVQTNDRGKAIESVQSFIRVAKAQKRLTYKEYFEKLGVVALSDLSKLTDEQLTESIKYLEELTK